MELKEGGIGEQGGKYYYALKAACMQKMSRYAGKQVDTV